MATMAICRFHMAKRFLALHLGIHVRFLVGQYHVWLRAAQVQTATTDTRGANWLTAPFSGLADIYILYKEDSRADIVGPAYLRIRFR